VPLLQLLTITMIMTMTMRRCLMMLDWPVAQTSVSCGHLRYSERMVAPTEAVADKMAKNDAVSPVSE
jgi:hypothetical protein